MSSQILDSRELERLLSAAAVSKTFRHLLLDDPTRALVEGYQGERFRLDDTSHSLLKSLHVTTLPEFAQHLLKHSTEL